MEASSSTNPSGAPATPSHASLLPALSPSNTLEATPAPLHSLPAHLYTHPHPHSQSSPHLQQSRPPPPPQPLMGPPPPQALHGNSNVFGTIMGHAPGQVPQHTAAGGGLSAAKVYASVYSGIPVFEAMIRGISVMRRTADSWVNATQILKVAGIPKSARTKILEKEILTGEHEKVQGGYGKYQGTWIPFQRGQDLAAQYGVTAYLSPIFDFIPSPSNVASLPLVRNGTPDAGGQKTPNNTMAFYPALSGSGRMISPYTHGLGQGLPPPPPPQFVNGEGQLMNLQMGYGGQPMYFAAQPRPMPMEEQGSLAPPADINGIGLPPASTDVYLDQYGQPQQMFHAQYPNGDMQPPPPKRQRSNEQSEYANGVIDEIMEEDAEEDADSVDDLRDAPPLPTSMRLSDKPLRPKPSAHTDRIRQKILAVFAQDKPTTLRATFGLEPTAAPDFDMDMIIDKDGHTALHWACSLAKLDLIPELIELGADIHRGNYAGETPLIRSVLTTNHFDAGTFEQLLQYLAPSIQTLDHAYRSVVHHIALVAGIKGRAASARAYMAGVLEWVAKENREANGNSTSPTLKNLVDVQDVHGDTALNVAARVGNKGLVTLLLDAGADKARVNKLGLKPQDFGIEVDALKLSPAEAVVSSLKSEVPKPERQSRDVQKNISAIFENINEAFAAEMTAKQTKLNTTEASVRHATRSLADKRQAVQRAQAVVSELEQIRQKTENVRRSLVTVSAQDWTGRSLGGGPAFSPLPQHVPAPQISESLSTEMPFPQPGEPGAIIKLRRMVAWEDRIAQLLESRTRALEGESTDMALKYRRLVSLCTKVPVDKVDGMLDGLTTAVESDGQTMDLGRIAGFMSRMKEQAA
ncbi:hypothetical protein BCR39DRAFT_544274 [Naematelia encephala]|uniref:HTH APSES-type domain-containing protein n=1 Tax=Naematelia encephala TaxID=71784 RepID=A0A1Y2ARZ3_9TREE|nr:hypothetical protein BCR39DRAFT_544274 [Naematelia encephala]